MKEYLEPIQNIPDSIKVMTAVAAPGLSLMGISIEEWTFILSGIVSVMFIVEKFPMLFNRAASLYRWIKNGRKK